MTCSVSHFYCYAECRCVFCLRNVNYCVVKYGITTMKTLPVVWTCHQVA